MIEKELEKTFLAKTLPKGLKQCQHREIIDIYIPKEAEHPTVRIRKNGEKFEITKKEPIANDASEQDEHTIPLKESEFTALAAAKGKRLEKERYYFPFEGRTLEIDIFGGKLAGLVLVDAEFKTREEKNSFEMPSFCLAEVTQEKFSAGGMLCGKNYEDIEPKLKAFGYKRLQID
jgi:CYTH domain-containing protein